MQIVQQARKFRFPDVRTLLQIAPLYAVDLARRELPAGEHWRERCKPSARKPGDRGMPSASHTVPDRSHAKLREQVPPLPVLRYHLVRLPPWHGQRRHSRECRRGEARAPADRAGAEGDSAARALAVNPDPVKA